MPDLIVHAVSGYLLSSKNWRNRCLPSIFLLGCIFPDLIRGPILIISNLSAVLDMNFASQKDVISLQILHSPFPLLVQVWLVSYLFEEKLRGKVFFNFLSGVVLHLLLDAGQRSYHISYLWLFPFSFSNPINGLWWADDSTWLTLSALFLGGFVFLLRYRR